MNAMEYKLDWWQRNKYCSFSISRNVEFCDGVIFVAWTVGWLVGCRFRPTTQRQGFVCAARIAFADKTLLLFELQQFSVFYEFFLRFCYLRMLRFTKGHHLECNNFPSIVELVNDWLYVSYDRCTVSNLYKLFKLSRGLKSWAFLWKKKVRTKTHKKTKAIK